MFNNAMISSARMDWETPQEFFDKLDKEFNFTLDPCATADNAKCGKYYTVEDNGLLKSWKGERVFCNPPYGREISLWVEKCNYEANNGAEIVVLLIPSRTDTQYFHKFIYKKHEIRFIKGRLHFDQSKRPAPFPSMIVIMNKNN